MRRRSRSVVMGAAFTAIATAALGATVPAKDSRIVEVTVYPDRAEVVREARVDLPGGASTVEFAGLPSQVEPDSLRVTAKGIAASLGAVELKEIAAQPVESPDFLAAKDDVDRIQRDFDGLRAASGTAKEMRDFLTSLRASTAQRESEKIGEGKADPNSIAAIFSLIRTQLQVLDTEALARNERQKKLSEQLLVAQAKLNAARPAASIQSRTATIEVETEQAGSLTVRLAYVSPGAMWRPAYRASLDAATGDIALTSEAVVRQSSGEDWTGVALRLSTAAPARGVNPPEMASLLLRPQEVMAFEKKVSGARTIGVIARPQAPALETGASGQNFNAEAVEGLNQITSENQQSSIVHSSYNVAFEVPGRSDVPADSREHRVGLKQETLHGKVQYRAAPAIQPAAFLVAKAEAPADYPLLAGPVRVFAGGAYLGAFEMAETAPKAGFTLPFGVDNRVAVDRKPLPQERSQEGVISKERRIAYAYRTTVENLRDQKVTIVVEDRRPVSEDERIEVETGKETTPGFVEVKERPGVLEWTLDLAPREKKEIILEYAVRFPRDMVVPGLE